MAKKQTKIKYLYLKKLKKMALMARFQDGQYICPQCGWRYQGNK